MSEPKPFASLGPTLLARKGGAKPAMRPQLGALAQPVETSHEVLTQDDLGWNDMGHDHHAETHHAEPAEVVSLTPEAPVPLAVEPEVHRQQREVARRINAERRSALAAGRRAAFTLRVDAERHLKLRLACTLRNRSAQQLVTDALDRLLDELPDVAALAAQVSQAKVQ